MTRFLFQVLLICIVLIAAWRAGGKPERYIATTYFAMLALGSLHAWFEQSLGQVSYGRFYDFRALLDLAALGTVVFVALRYDRWWTLWVGSVQFIAVMAHLLRILDMPIPPPAYAVMERWPVWLALMITGVGIFLHSKRQPTTATDI
jgi:hypothetical protein